MYYEPKLSVQGRVSNAICHQVPSKATECNLRSHLVVTDLSDRLYVRELENTASQDKCRATKVQTK